MSEHSQTQFEEDRVYAPIQREWIVELAEELADALHDFDIGRDISGLRTASSVFDSLKAILEERYEAPAYYIAERQKRAD